MRYILAMMMAVVLALPARADVEITEVVSPGGITAWLVEEPSIPFTAMELRFRGGASLDAPGKRGATNLMTGLLEEGAADMDARAFARALEGLAASFSYDVGDDALAVSARFLTENRDAAVELLRASLLEPAFDPEAVERVRQQVLTGLLSDEKNPEELAARAFDKLAYGDHPYGTSYTGTVDSVSALTRDDLVAAHDAVLAKDRLYVGVVGDITPEELGPLLDELLGDLPEVGAPLPEMAEVDIPGGVTVIDFETPQSVALFGQPGMAQKDPDFFAATVLNQVLGGGSFESRLMNEVREKRGLTYGVYSYLVPRDYAATYMGRVASANDRIEEAIAVIRDEWAKAASEGVTEDELRDAKTYLTGAYPLRFDGNAPIARIMVGMQMLGLPIDYIATRNEMVEAVTMDDVKRVADELLDPDGLHFVVVGQPEGLETGPLPE
ncbi:M16 family metallopeptidase [Pseudosulfitobacter koreensis]|uniref:Insulinase family protein n=1 Tax=Pseudosulfitobacter koreensis TaxID=2968472 RepID=A0ABT1Z1A9_9RHOB|nr:pitrilysin family protein [Pseudosulfitobacter koreense]MCR8826903.1 insulinase family protein [Pseudosulfitobacter koreense]